MHVMHINSSRASNKFQLRLGDQQSFVWNITNWLSHRPAFVHGHFAYLSFQQFGANDPYYINIIRHPMDRLVSYYYFLRYGDDYRKGLARSKQGDTTTFDECVVQKGRDCQTKNLWLQIPFICGMSSECWKVDSEWALQQAKRNVVEKYFVIGVTEQIEDLIVVLESSLPEIFKGASKKFRGGNKQHVRNTLHKDPPSQQTLDLFKKTKTYKMEMEFYNFVVSVFNSIKKMTTYTDGDGLLQPYFQQQWRYGKTFGPSGKVQ